MLLTPLPPTALAGDAAFYADILGEGTLVTALTRLAEGAPPEALGLAFAPGQALGFEWRFSKTGDTAAWDTERGSSVAHVRLDVRPVRMARPLYTAEPVP